MKKILTVLAIIALVSSVSVGQMTITKGIKGGLNFATWGGSELPAGIDIKYVTQFTGGIFFNLSLPFNLSVQPEVLYTVKGAKGVAGPVTGTQTIQYIEVPILAKYSLPTFGIVTPSVFAGPSFGGRLGAKLTMQDTVGSSTVDNKTIFSDKDIVIVIGAGAIFNLGPVDAVLDVRYNLGIWMIDRPEKTKVYNRGISLMAGIML